MFFHATTTTFETPCSWVFTKEGGSTLLQVGGKFKQELKL